MSIRVRCPNPKCGTTYNANESQAGRTFVCKACGKKFALSSSSRSENNQAGRSTEGKTSSTTPGPGVPTNIGRFQVRSRLGAGGFGTVYLAHDPVLDREVALKVPHRGSLESEKKRTRFLREGKAAARFRHPNIVPVYEAGADGETYYIASAFIQGQTLRDAISAGRFDFQRSVKIVQDLAGALDYAHRQGVEIGMQSGPTSARNLDPPLASKVSAGGSGVKGLFRRDC